MNSAHSKSADHLARTSFSPWQKAVLFGVAYFLCAEAGSFLSVRGGAFITFWLPGGLYLAGLLLNRTRDWPWLVLAALLANLVFDHFYGTRFVETLAFYCANTIQALTGAWLVRRFVAERPALDTLKEFFGLIGLAAIFSAMMGAVIGAATVVYFGFSHSFEQSWKIWWGSNAMAMLVLTPFILVWFPKPNGRRNDFDPPKKVAEAVLLFLGLSLYLGYLLGVDKGIMSPNKSLAIPFLLWAGLRFGARGATAASLFLSLTLAFFTTQFSAGLTAAQVASGAYVFPMQTVLAMASLVALIPAIVIGERDRMFAKSSESEEKFSKAFQSNPNGICITELDTGKYVAVNKSFSRLFGYTQEEMVGHTSVELRVWTDVADRARLIQPLLATGSVHDFQMLTRDRNGENKTVMVSAEVIELGGKQCAVFMLLDITSRVRAEAERAEAQLREAQSRTEYTFQLIASQEAERTRIAAELHDSLGQNLLLIKNNASLALTDKTAAARARLEDISTLAAQAIAEVRQISHDLHPYQLDHLGLTRTLEAMIDNTAQASGIVFERKLDSVDAIFSTEAATNLYRIVQETVNNILKHSGAKCVRIALESDVREVELRIEDDGCGFKPGNAGSAGKGLGLKNIAERTRILNGKLKVDSKPGHGTRIEVTIPIAEIG